MLMSKPAFTHPPLPILLGTGFSTRLYELPKMIWEVFHIFPCSGMSYVAWGLSVP